MKTFKQYFEESVNEASKIDISYAIQDIKNHNNKSVDFDTTIKNIVSNLGYKTTNKNLTNAKEHIYYSMENNKIPVDKDLVRELYQILESKKEQVNEANIDNMQIETEWNKIYKEIKNKRYKEAIKMLNGMVGILEKIN